MDVAAADAPDLVALAVAGAMVPVVPLGRTRSTPTFLQSATVIVFVSEEEVRCQYRSGLSAGQNREFYGERVGLLSRSAAEQPFDTSGKRALSQPVLLQIQLRSLRVHWLVLILFKAGA